MYKESVKSSHKAVLFSAAIIIVAFVFMWSADMLITYFRLPYRSIYQLGAIVVASIGVYILIRNISVEYEYVLSDNYLTVTSRLGINVQTIAHICINSIQFISVYNSPSLNEIKTDESYSAKKTFANERVYVCIYNQDGKLCRLNFEPSEKLLTLLQKDGVIIK